MAAALEMLGIAKAGVALVASMAAITDEAAIFLNLVIVLFPVGVGRALNIHNMNGPACLQAEPLLLVSMITDSCRGLSGGHPQPGRVRHSKRICPCRSCYSHIRGGYNYYTLRRDTHRLPRSGL